MTYTIDLTRVKNFAIRHKEALAVATVAVLLSRKRTRLLIDQQQFINSKGLTNEFLDRK